MKNLKTQKGITLVALVITIIVLLILAVVAIGAVRDSGIIGHAQNSADKYNIGKAEEESMIGQYEDVISKYETDGNFGTSGSGGSSFPAIDNTVPEEFEKYFLGSELKGRDLSEIFVEERINEDEKKYYFLNEDSTIPNAKEVFTIVGYPGLNDAIYIKDIRDSANVSFYKVSLNYSYDNETDEELEWISDITKIIELNNESRVGKTVKYDNKIWTILYDDNINGVQMVTNEVLKYNNDTLDLGSRTPLIEDWDSLMDEVDLNNDKQLESMEKNIYTYNNAIDLLNKACDDIVADHYGIDVRCAGSNPIDKRAENKTMYTSEFLARIPENNASYKTGIFNGKLKGPDNNYVSDLDRMIVLGINETSANYWLATRYIEELEEERLGGKYSFDFTIAHSSESYSQYHMQDIRKDGAGGDYPNYYYLRPVARIENGVKLVADSSGEADYIIK